jgi:hypothetical protein
MDDGLGARATVLAGHAPSTSLGNCEFAANVRFSDTDQNTDKTEGCRELLRVLSTSREDSSGNPESNQRLKLLLLLIF